GRAVGAGAGGSGRRAVLVRSWTGARLLAAGWTDRREIRTESVWRERFATLPDRRFSALPGGGRTGVSRPRRQSGEAARLPHRVGRDRNSAARSRAGARRVGRGA